MAFGVDYTGFLDSFDAGKVVGTNAQKDARERANAFLDTAKVGGAGVDIFGQMRRKEILDDAKRAANSTTDTAGAVSGGLDFLGNMGSFGAAGGFDPTKSFMDGGLFGTTPIGAGGGTLPKLGLFGKETVGTLGPNWGLPQ